MQKCYIHIIKKEDEWQIDSSIPRIAETLQDHKKHFIYQQKKFFEQDIGKRTSS